MADENSLRYDAAVHLMEARKICDQLRAQSTLLRDEEHWERICAAIDLLELDVQPEEAARKTWDRHIAKLTGR